MPQRHIPKGRDPKQKHYFAGPGSPHLPNIERWFNSLRRDGSVVHCHCGKAIEVNVPKEELTAWKDFHYLHRKF